MTFHLMCPLLGNVQKVVDKDGDHGSLTFDSGTIIPQGPEDTLLYTPVHKARGFIWLYMPIYGYICHLGPYMPIYACIRLYM